MKTLIVAMFSLTLLTTACGKKTEGGDKAKPAEGGGKTGGAPAKLEWKKIASLGLEVEVPVGSNIDDNTATSGFPSATLWAPSALFIMGGDMIPSDYDGAKAQAQKETDGFKAFSKDEKTATGWHLEFEGVSNIDKSVVYGFSIRMAFDGKNFDCSTNANSKEERDAAIKICHSVRKAGA